MTTDPVPNPDLADLFGLPDGMLPPGQGGGQIPGFITGNPLPFPIPTTAPNGFGGTQLGNLAKNPGLNGTELPLHSPKDVAGEWVPDYATAHQAMKPAAENLEAHASDWQALHDNVVTARNEFNSWLDRTLQEPDGWHGQTATTIVAKAKESLSKLDELAMAASTMSILLAAFGNCIGGTRNLIIGREEEWQNEVLKCSEGSTPETRKDKENQLNLFAQEVIGSLYNPTILSIGGKHPEISTAAPQVGAPGGGPSGLGGAGGGGGGGVGGLKSGGLGLPGIPSPTDFTGAGGADPSASQPTMPANALQGAGDAANGAGDAAKNAAGQGSNAASQALDQAMKAGKNPSGLPEGMLGLGPKGLNELTKASGSGGRGAGGGGARGASPANLSNKLATPLTPVNKAAAVASTPTSRAGLSQAGGSGAGAPMAGHQGGKAGKDHKASKALRSARHGQELIGEADAVVPVVGDEGKTSIDGKTPPTAGRRD